MLFLWLARGPASGPPRTGQPAAMSGASAQADELLQGDERGWTSPDAAWVSAMHEAEVANGLSLYAPHGSRTAEMFASAYSPSIEFTCHDVGVGNAGPDEGMLRDGHLVHATTAPILTLEERSSLMAEAAEAMKAGATSRFTYTAASRIDEVHTAELPGAREWLAAKLRSTIFPMLEERFGGDGMPVRASELAVYDSLIIRYDASRGGTQQPMHRDGALLSVNIALGGDYTGGGTRFEASGSVLQNAPGHAMVHSSGARHAGHPISSGERWVLVVFVLARGVPQVARRAGERAIEHRRAGNLDAARADFLLGLHASPADHELHHGLAAVMAMQGEEASARQRLRHASSLYPPCPKPRNGLGAMLLAAGRTRAALRWFEAALVRSAEADDDDGWDASVNAALCTLLLAEQEAAREARAGTPSPAARVVWRGPCFAQARLWLWCAFASAPQDTRLLDLLRRFDAVPGAVPADEAAVRAVLRGSASRQRARLGSSLVRSWDMMANAPSGRASASAAAATPSSAGGGTLVIAFAGADAALGGGINGGVPSHEFVRACRKAGVRRALFVRDVLRAWYLRGVGGRGGDSFEGVMALLRDEIAAVRPSRVVTIGSSMGGYAAVRAALALEADAALAFAPQVAIDPAERQRRGLPPAPFDALLGGLSAVGHAEGFRLESLDEIVRGLASRHGGGVTTPGGRAHRQPTIGIEIHCGDADPGDVAEARTLEAVVSQLSQGVEAAAGGGGVGFGVTCAVKVHEARDHNLVVEMRDSGELHDLLRSLVAEEEGAAPDAAEIPSDFEGFANCPDF